MRFKKCYGQQLHLKSPGVLPKSSVYVVILKEMRFGGMFRPYLKSSLDSCTHSNELVNQMDSNLYKMWQWFWVRRKSNSKVKGHKVSVLIILEISSLALTTNYFVQFEISRYLNLYEHQWIIIYFTRLLVTGVT